MSAQIQFEVNRSGKKQQSVETIETLFKQIIKHVEVQMERSSCFIMNLGTGLGKSTQFIYDLLQNFTNHKIVCSQVTVINTIDLCKGLVKRMQGLEMGKNIGYTTSSSKMPPSDFHSIHYQTLKLTTIKYLLEIQNDRLKNPQSYIIVIDEAHSNDVNSQEQLAVVRQLLITKKREQLPFFIIQSASIDVNQYMNYFKLDSYIFASGSRKPVKELFLDDFNLLRETNVYNATMDVIHHIVQGCFIQEKRQNIISDGMAELKVQNPTSILIFIAKQKQATMLEKRLATSEIFKKSGLRVVSINSISLEKDPEQISREDNPTPKIFIATNVIETGYTISNISFVIDLLKYKSVYKNPISKVDIVRDNPIDKQMQQQRRGRVGRTQPGIYIGICPKSVSDKLVPKRELQIQLSNIQSNIVNFEHGIQSFLTLEFMQKIPSEHFIDYLQISALIGEDNMKNKNHNIVQNLLFSSIRFKDFRQVLLLILTINVGLRPLDIIYLMSFILTANMFKPNYQTQVNDYRAIYQMVTKGQQIDVKLSDTIQQLILFMKQNNINIYQGTPLDSDEGASMFATCMAVAYYFFMFKRESNTTFVSRQGIRVNLQLPKEIDYFVCMYVELQQNYNCKYISPITIKDWNILPCKL